MTPASLLPVRRLRRVHDIVARDVFFLVGLAVTFALQLWYALRLIATSTDRGAARGIAILVVVCFLIGIARAWELIGGPSIGLGPELAILLRGGYRPPGSGSAEGAHRERYEDDQ
ncbi:MAG: hypothetical protein ABI323_07705 [Solirubrobacteraceae bacterium]